MTQTKLATLGSIAALTLAAAGGAYAQASGMTFFITSTGSGKGADFGGLAGADKHCATLAAAVGAGNKSWRAYLSASASGSSPAVNARDRIGKGPWQNAKGVVVAKDVAELHGSNNLTKQTAVDEKGAIVNGRGDTPNQHDILTGSTAAGMATADHCNSWTSSAATGVRAQVGHHDRDGGGADPTSWSSAHATGGCSAAAFVATGGRGSFYCFAAD